MNFEELFLNFAPLPILLIAIASIIYVIVSEVKRKQNNDWNAVAWIAASLFLPVVIPAIYYFYRREEKRNLNRA